MKFQFIGWCKEGIHDKVWGVITLSTSYQGYGDEVLTFWGRRGAKLQTKLALNDNILYKLINSKRNKGYIEIDPTQLEKVYPEFENDLEKTAIWASLKM